MAIGKRYKHHHFWIEDEILYESYYDLTGLRYSEVMPVPEMPNETYCGEACMKFINLQYENETI